MYCNAGITTPQTLKIEGHIKKKKVQAMKYEEEKYQETSKGKDSHQEPTLEKEEMNMIISCKALARITTPQTLKIEGNIKKKKVQAVKDQIEHQQQVLQLLKDNTLWCRIE